MKSAPQSARFWVILVAAVVVAGSTFSLGQWQLRRAALKESLQAAIQSKNTLPALDAKAFTAIENIANEVHRPVSIQGTWEPSRTVYLDNRPMNGKPGFWVLTPLRIQDSTEVIVVQRGWAPRNFMDRSQLPEVQTPAGLVTVVGRIAPPPSKLYAFKGVDTGRIRQNLDIEAFRAETGLPLLPASILQIGAAGEGLMRDWAPPNLGVEKHYGYAFQWFGLFALVIGLYGWFQVFIPLRSRLHIQHSDQIS